jgi:hypothetical protein
VREKAELPTQRLEGLPLGVVGGTELQLHGNMGGDVDGGVGRHHQSVDRRWRRPLEEAAQEEGRGRRLVRHCRRKSRRW